MPCSGSAVRQVLRANERRHRYSQRLPPARAGRPAATLPQQSVGVTTSSRTTIGPVAFDHDRAGLLANQETSQIVPPVERAATHQHGGIQHALGHRENSNDAAPSVRTRPSRDGAQGTPRKIPTIADESSRQPEGLRATPSRSAPPPRTAAYRVPVARFTTPTDQRSLRVEHADVVAVDGIFRWALSNRPPGQSPPGTSMWTRRSFPIPPTGRRSRPRAGSGAWRHRRPDRGDTDPVECPPAPSHRGHRGPGGSRPGRRRQGPRAFGIRPRVRTLPGLATSPIRLIALWQPSTCRRLRGQI